MKFIHVALMGALLLLASTLSSSNAAADESRRPMCKQKCGALHHRCLQGVPFERLAGQKMMCDNDVFKCMDICLNQARNFDSERH